MHTKFLSKTLKGRALLEDLEADEIIIKSVLEKWSGMLLNEFIWLGTETSGGFL
jgi:hypothetical protein